MNFIKPKAILVRVAIWLQLAKKPIDDRWKKKVFVRSLSSVGRN